MVTGVHFYLFIFLISLCYRFFEMSPEMIRACGTLEKLLEKPGDSNAQDMVSISSTWHVEVDAFSDEASPDFLQNYFKYAHSLTHFKYVSCKYWQYIARRGGGAFWWWSTTWIYRKKSFQNEPFHWQIAFQICKYESCTGGHLIWLWWFTNCNISALNHLEKCTLWM